MSFVTEREISAVEFRDSWLVFDGSMNFVTDGQTEKHKSDIRAGNIRLPEFRDRERDLCG